MSNILQYSPGQTVTLVFEVLNALGSRSDGYDGYTIGVAPLVSRIIFPNLSLASGYPQNMTRLDVGLFLFHFVLPKLAASVGSYIVDINYLDPDDGHPRNTFFQVISTAPFGQYSVSTF